MLRNVNWVRLFGSLFILLVLAVVFFIYYVLVFIAFRKYIYAESLSDVSFLAFFYLIITHAVVFMFLWSFIQTTITDPGKVPLHWGFHLDDIEIKKRRYCLICHIFKPERCHHCSMCNRCVLNMDHHCPWVNNCIGFHNRKFFLLVLFYATLSLIAVLCGLTPAAIDAIIFFVKEFAYNQHFVDSILILASETALIVLFFLLIFFFKYHIDLLRTNTTTIEDLERKRSGTAFNYDIGEENNFYQVFGVNPWMWPFPFYGESGKPLGDGVNWDQRFVSRDIKAEMELPSERRMDS